MAVDKIYLARLVDVYSPFLTKKQFDILNMYCDCDCSLSEISDEIGISRQGVRDAIVSAEKNLLMWESTIHYLEVFDKLQKALDENDIEKAKSIVKSVLLKE